MMTVYWEWCHPLVLWLLIVPLLLVALYVLRQVFHRQPHLRVSTLLPWQRSGFSPVRIVRHIPFALRILALVLIILALARPRTVSEEFSSETRGIDIMMALDVSGSMSTRDFDGGMSRVEALKMTAAQFIGGRPADRIGLVLFGSESYTLCPLTGDRDALVSLVGSIQIGYVDEDGTAIGEGLATAVARIKDSEAESKVIILLTDGVNNTGNVSPANATELAVNNGIKVYTIGMSGEWRDPRWPISMQQEDSFDEQLLKDIAAQTDGAYFKATDNTKFAEIFDEINRLDKTELEVNSWVRYEDLFPELGLAALIMLIAELLLRLFLRRLP